jgi:acetoin utilization deacetylase AcuC-like enzyme
MHERCRDHDPGLHPDRPARYDAAAAAVSASEATVAEAPAAPLEAMARVHDPAYLDALRVFCERGGGPLDADTIVGLHSFEAAAHACGGGMAAVDAVLDGASASALVAGRPPGHHAERARAMGFCIIDQVAVAAAHAVDRGLERVAVLDWDVHHGNGTQALFWEDPAVLYVSLHQYGGGFFPGTGSAGERGAGAGEGATVNVPLPAGTGEAAYLEAYRTRALPAVAAHRPQLVLVSSGFDAHRDDPLGSLGLSERAFATMTRELAATGLPQVHVLEGGYDLGALERSLAAVLAVLAEG